MFRNDLVKSLEIVDIGLEYIETTISGIMDIQYICANKGVLSYYNDLLNNIQKMKNENGDYVAPDDLREAAYELQKELEGNISSIIDEMISQIGFTTAETGIKVLKIVNINLLNQITVGIDVGTLVGNAIFDMGSLVKGASYVQGYAYIGEIYSVILKKDKEKFLKDKSEKNAQQFRKDYEILYNIRIKGEEAYLDMSDFSETWKKEDRKTLQIWTDYASKEKFCNNNLELIKSFRFKEPPMTVIQQNELDYMEAYNQVIDLYSQSSQKDYAVLEKENINPLVNTEGVYPLFYMLYDLNNDDIPELVIAKANEKYIIDIRTLCNGEVIRVFNDEYRLGIENSCTIGQDNYIYIFEPCGAFKAYEYIYKLTNDSKKHVKEIKVYEMNADEYNSIKYFDITNGNKTEISKDKYDSSVMNKYNNGARFNWDSIVMQ